MNMLSVMKYYARIYRVVILVFTLLMVASLLMNAWAMVQNTRNVIMAPNAQGVITEHVTYNNLSFYSDLSHLNGAAPFGILGAILALASIKKDRQFLVSCSVPRYRIWLGTCGFLILISVLMSLMGTFIAPSVCRAGLMAIGFPLKDGLRTVLTGGDPNIIKTLGISIMSNIGLAGIYMLLGYLFVRWWKIILILMGLGIVSLILLANMVRWQSFIAEVLYRFADQLQALAENLIPRLEQFFSEDNRLTWARFQLLGGCISMLLSYPIMRGMKVV